MAVAWRSSGTVASRSSDNTSALTVTQPAGHQAGDILILIAFSYHGAGAATINTPAGWTLISASAAWANSNTSKCAAFYKIAASSSEPSVSVSTATTSFMDCQISAFSGADGTTPIDANTSWVTSGASSTSFTCQAITTVTNNALLVYFICDNDGATYGTPPTGVTERAESGPTFTGFDFVVATKTKTPAGSESSGTYTKTTGPNGGIGIVVALAIAGGGGAAFVPQTLIIS